jgi:protease-4
MLVGWGLLSLFTGLGLGGACSTCVQGAAGGQEDIIAGSRDRVGVVELSGAIMDVTDFVRDVRAFAKRDDLRAILVRIDSPGGAVGPSQEAYDALRFAAKEKIIVASMGTVAASGGFWTAMGADYIFANPGTITGSIGVITQLPDLRGIADVLRFSMHTFKSGPLKDAGNPLREMTPLDAQMFQSMIDDIYSQFVGVVAERRKLELEAVKKIADGRVITGRAAKELGLVDEMGGLYDAAKKAVALANERDSAKEGSKTSTITDVSKLEDPTLVYPKKPMPSVLEMLTQSAQSAIARGLSDGIDRAASRAEESVTSRKVELR